MEPVSCIAWLGVCIELREGVELELWKRENEQAARATTDEKVESRNRTERSETQKRGCVENCRAKTLEKLELAGDAELPSRQSAELASDAELE